MDKDLLVQNIIRCCLLKGEPPTVASVNAGLGKDFLSDIKRGRTPSVAKVAALAAYLGVSTSDLVGDSVSNSDTGTRLTPREMKLVTLYRQSPELAPAVDKLLGMEE